MLRLAVPLLVAGLCALAALPAAAQYPPPKSLGHAPTAGAKLQRSMTLLATSSARKRHTVRVLFYGQSITEQDWSKDVAEDLRRRFPLCDLVIENRAIPGFTSHRLVKTAEADLYPFYPDLVIFHDYGAGPHYEAIIRRIRERTAADILQANDHLSVVLGETVDEETDPAKLTARDGPPWDNHVVLPGIAKKYDTEFADVRGAWKRYLIDHKLKVADLLCDPIHLNPHGCYLMGEIIKPHLRHRPELSDEAWSDRVQTFEVGTDIDWKNGKLTLPFEGNRVELICKEGVENAAVPVTIRIDGKKPSEFPELFVPTRTELLAPRVNVPGVLRVQAEASLVLEEWTMHLWTADPARKAWRFKVAGSVTGEDGEGEVGKRFVSKSGRVVIEADDWNAWMIDELAVARKLTSMVVGWRVVPLYSDTFAVPEAKNPFGDTVVIAAQGLTNGRHTLELSGGPDAPLSAIRVHRPPMGRN